MKTGLLLVGLVTGIAHIAVAQTSGPGLRVALIIGNSNYQDTNAPLSQPVNDARALADELRRAGFIVDVGENLTKDGMVRAIDSFKQKITPGSAALLFFSGFGIQSGRQNYMIPVNAQIWSEADIRRDGISLESVLAEMVARRASVKIVIIDASRRDPYERRFRSSWDGLAALDVTDGTAVIYSAAPGKVANDSGGENSLFMTELLKQIRSTDLTIEEAFRRTRVNVARASNGERVPSESSTLIEDFYLGRPQARTAINPPPADPRPAPTPPPAPSTPDRSTVIFGPDLKPGAIFRDCPECPEMVVVPSGEFQMGSEFDYEKPVHGVSIARPFAIGRKEIRFLEWDICVAAGACKYRPDDRGLGRGERPVTDISWADAKLFLTWLAQKTGQKYRLPSEAEWEYAARAGTTSAYWWGRDVGTGRANCRDCGDKSILHTLPAGTFPANPFGLFDIAGNAAEWVEDCWNDTYRNAPKDGSAWTAGQCRQRVLRGGSFDNQARYLRSAARFKYDADVRYYANGFRVVRELQ